MKYRATHDLAADLAALLNVHRSSVGCLILTLPRSERKRKCQRGLHAPIRYRAEFDDGLSLSLERTDLSERFEPQRGEEHALFQRDLVAEGATSSQRSVR